MLYLFNVKTLAALILFLSFSVLAAPAPNGNGVEHHFLAKRSLLWPGRLFGGDRWGVVLGPPAPAPADHSGPTSPAVPAPEPESTSTTTQDQDPALNPAVSPSVTITPVLPSLNSTARSATANGFKALKPTTTRSVSTPVSSSTSVSVSTPKPTSTKPAPPKPTSTKTTVSTPPPPKPTSTKTTQRPTFTSTKTAQPAPTSTSAPKPPPSDSGSSGSTSAADIAAYLKGHNDERAQHGASPLTWSDALAAKAQQWANNCQFKHSGGTLGPFGENLAAGTGDFSIAAGIKAWNDEEPDYDPSNPQASHWTQVVWKASTQVGCAVQRCNGIFNQPANFYVCEYSPAGNFIGRFPENVQK